MKKFVFFILLANLIFVCGVAFCDIISTSTVIHKATETYKNAVNIPKNKIIVYPNPWIPESGISGVEDDAVKKNTLKHGHLSAEGWIKFAGMQQKTGTLRIYDITGNLVRNFHWNTDDERDFFPVAEYEFSSVTPISGSSTTINYYETQEHYDKETNGYRIIHWDGKDNNYEYVKSGVYIWILTEDGGNSHHGKIAIVR